MGQKYSILVAEDNSDIAKLLKLYLDSEGYDVVIVTDGAEGCDAAKNNNFAAIIADIMMPNMNGYDMIKCVRSFSNVPILILSAKNEDIDKILGLNIGADDYITKPFNPLEVVARVNAAIRRSRVNANESSTIITYKNLILDTSACRLTNKGEEIFLTAKEYKILQLLMRAPKRIFSKKQISQFIDGDNWLDDDIAITVHISHLRSKLGICENEKPYIKNIKGLGYKLDNDN